jgi:hypothetical protein
MESRKQCAEPVPQPLGLICRQSREAFLKIGNIISGDFVYEMMDNSHSAFFSVQPERGSWMF